MEKFAPQPPKRPRGRPRGRVSPRITIQIRLLPEVDALIEKRAAKLGIPKGQYIEHVVKTSSSTDETISYTEARARLDELSSLLETAHLVRSPANARRLAQALQEVASITAKKMTLAQLKKQAGARPG
jgi:hypothetical protein